MKESRRQFLKWVGVAPVGAMLLFEAGCGTASSTDVRGGADAGDAGRGRDVGAPDVSTADGSTADASAADVSTADAARGADVGEAPDADAAVGDAGACEPTGADVEGPFHIDGAPSRTTLAGPNEPGERIVVEGTVFGPDCLTPVAGALLDVWHADANGDYDDSTTDYRLRGQMQTGADGKYRFDTIMPGRYPLGGSTRPAHIHFMISKPGLVPLTTQMYFAGDPFLSPNDPCGRGCNSGDRTLIVPFSDTPAGAKKGTFDIVLTRP